MAEDDKEKRWFYNDVDDTLTIDTCNESLHLMKILCSISGDIYEALSTASGVSDELLDQVETVRDELYAMHKATENLLTSDAIYNLAHFDINKRIDELLQREYSADAYEENLEHYVGLASATANEEFQQLALTAEDAMKEAIEKLKAFWGKYRIFLKSFNRLELKTENPVIDNT